MSYTLVEPCAGSAALTFHLKGAKRGVVPYQGSKWRYRRQITAVAEVMGFEGPPERVILNDPGPWGITLKALLDPSMLQSTIGLLTTYASRDPQAMFDIFQGETCARSPSIFAAQHLFLQRLSHSGKAVGVTRKSTWKSPGFNKTSAYGVKATDKFGAVNPMIPALISRLSEMQEELDFSINTTVFQGGADHTFVEFTGIYRNMLVYIDPPYAEGTPYPNGSMSRPLVRKLAYAYTGMGAGVIVSEAEPLDWPGWEHICIAAPGNGSAPFRSKKPEFLTYHPPSGEAL